MKVLKKGILCLPVFVFIMILSSCASIPSSSDPESGGSLPISGYPNPTPISDATNGDNYSLTTAQVIQTSSSGDKLAAEPAITFQTGDAQNNTIVIRPDLKRQTLVGIGGSLTESSAYVLACLDTTKRSEILNAYFSTSGANYTISRTHIGACDFSVEGMYSYDDTNNDTNFTSFSINPDKAGFNSITYPSIVDSSYDLLPLIKDALLINPNLKIMATPWTSPTWMKISNVWYANAGNYLKSNMYPYFAQYTRKYLEAYQAEGINIWAITPENEPGGNGGNFESLQFDENSMLSYIKDYLGPELAANGFSSTKIFLFDHNRDWLTTFVTPTLSSSAGSAYISGTAVHWYSSTTNVYDAELDAVHNMNPSKSLIHTEGCIDALGDDPDSEPLYCWWKTDSWWWNKNATDWGWKWSSKSVHPKYAPVHRYARDIIEGLNHWFIGWIDWNIVLDKRGGPNHVSNFCGAPIMVDTSTKEIYYTPLYYVMCQFSKYLQPDDQIVKSYIYAKDLTWDDIHVTAAVSKDGKKITVIAFNTTASAITFKLQIGIQNADISIPGNAIQTIVITKP